jgi:hypothetical protein
MLLLQARKLRAKLAFFLLRHCRVSRALDRAWPFSPLPWGRPAGKSLWSIAFWLTSHKPGHLVHSGDFRPAEKGVYYDQVTLV